MYSVRLEMKAEDSSFPSGWEHVSGKIETLVQFVTRLLVGRSNEWAVTQLMFTQFVNREDDDQDFFGWCGQYEFAKTEMLDLTGLSHEPESLEVYEIIYNGLMTIESDLNNMASNYACTHNSQNLFYRNDQGKIQKGTQQRIEF